MSLIHQLYAQTYSLEGPGVNPNKYGNPTLTLERIISVVIGVISIVAFIYFAFQIIFAGYEFISAQGDPKRLETSRKRITEGVMGLIVVVVAMGLTGLIAYLSGIPDIFNLNLFFTALGL